MKSLASVLIVAVEVGLAYLWQALSIAAAGRVLVFYYWAWAVLILLIVGIAAHPNFKLPKSDPSPRWLRYFNRAACAVRVLGLAAIGRPVLASVYLVDVVLIYLMLRVAPAPKSGVPEEGV